MFRKEDGAVDRRPDGFWMKMLLIGLPVMVLVAWYVGQTYGVLAMQGVIIGGSISLVNGVIGFALVKWGLQKSPTALIGAVLGGFLLRLFMVMFAVLALIQLTAVNPYALGLSVVGFHFLFMVLELYSIREWLFPDKISLSRPIRGQDGEQNA